MGLRRIPSPHHGEEMKTRIVLIVAVCALLGALAMWGPFARTAFAVGGPYSNDTLRGTYAAQLSGALFVPAPFDKLNGSFLRTMRIVADGNGRFDVTSVANYNGVVSRENYSATYNVTSEGMITVQIVNLPFPPAPGVPNVFTFEGVVADGGRIVKIALIGASLGGQTPPNIGSVIAGEIVRQ
jgi:hypothetical protein